MMPVTGQEHHAGSMGHTLHSSDAICGSGEERIAQKREALIGQDAKIAMFDAKIESMRFAPGPRTRRQSWLASVI